MPTCEEIVLMAAYNADMNQKLYAAAATLSHEQLVADRKAFFGSLLNTMCHIEVADIVWLKRFASHPAAFPALQATRELPMPPALDQPIAANLADWLELRRKLDAIISAWAAQVREADLAHPFFYANMKGDQFSRRFGSVVLHFFNHQTHHRGQASTLLSQEGVDIGVTDFLAWVPTIA
jgi:uncharacterized damage-inducible protein DinB